MREIILTQGKIAAKIHRKKSFSLGHFIDEEDAAIYYNIAAQLFHGEFAVLNQI